MGAVIPVYRLYTLMAFTGILTVSCNQTVDIELLYRVTVEHWCLSAYKRTV
jgi:hypothetical protein